MALFVSVRLPDAVLSMAVAGMDGAFFEHTEVGVRGVVLSDARNVALTFSANTAEIPGKSSAVDIIQRVWYNISFGCDISSAVARQTF